MTEVCRRNLCLFLILLTFDIACTRRSPILRTPVATHPSDGSYLDLQSSWRVRVVTPVLRSGGFELQLSQATQSGNVITESAEDLLGYETAYYKVSRCSSFLNVGRGDQGRPDETAVTIAGAQIPTAPGVQDLFD